MGKAYFIRYRECDLIELRRLDKIYNIEFERVSYPELVSMIDKGGKE